MMRDYCDLRNWLSVNAMRSLLALLTIRRLSEIAARVSLVNMNVPEPEPSGNDEIIWFSEFFSRMRRVRAIKMLEV